MLSASSARQQAIDETKKHGNPQNAIAWRSSTSPSDRQEEDGLTRKRSVASFARVHQERLREPAL